jgi:hypothetical protein
MLDIKYICQYYKILINTSFKSESTNQIWIKGHCLYYENLEWIEFFYPNLLSSFQSTAHAGALL